MARRYTCSLPDLSGVARDDWELLARVQQLFEPYRPIVSGREGWHPFTATDTRGEYTAATVDHLRELVAEQDDAPSDIRLFVAGRTVYGDDYELGVILSPSESRALLYSDSEAIVDHVATRLRALLGDREEEDKHAPATRAAGGATPAARVSEPTSPTRRQRIRGFLYDRIRPFLGKAAAVVGFVGVVVGIFVGIQQLRTSSGVKQTPSLPQICLIHAIEKAGSIKVTLAGNSGSARADYVTAVAVLIDGRLWYFRGVTSERSRWFLNDPWKISLPTDPSDTSFRFAMLAQFNPVKLPRLGKGLPAIPERLRRVGEEPTLTRRQLLSGGLNNGC
jgi:hypothetical protein